ncbi:8143_t:CDS:10 [Diversispora eburnea]|uniref:8143_t:CDS:1 n=1 Tax=Diversispora eburnea TaxID=1213867 RepID=A0A9N9AL47_9GLOM|nr:8143_t:CDS:10 [Diversispora eburnea]
MLNHGKSTLADRLLEITGTISLHQSHQQVLDKLNVERERGITIKAQTCSMFYKYKGKEYLLNLIDTPVISRSLAACQGSILLVDASQGIQAQTAANFWLAFNQDLPILPIDLDSANTKSVISQIENSFGLDTTDICLISAKSGINVDKILPKVIEKIPHPSGDINKPLKAFLFDSWYDTYVGVVCLMAIVDGKLQKGDKIVSAYSELKYEVSDIGIMYPEQVPTGYLHAGQVGYVILSMKVAAEAHIGDTFYHYKCPVKPLPGIFPVDANEFNKLDESIKKLTLNDASVSVQKETSMALGQGWRIGFLGTLHMDEYDASVIVTQPTVPYKIIYHDGKSKFVRNPSEFPEPDEMSYNVVELQEPMVMATLILPNEYMGVIMDLCGVNEHRVMMRYTLPLSEIVTDFHDELKSRSSGYASFDYEDMGYKASDVVKMNLLINKKPIDALAAILHRSQVQIVGRDWAKRLSEVIPKQLYEVAIQTAIGGKIIARETIAALRKNVTAKCVST